MNQIISSYEVAELIINVTGQMDSLFNYWMSASFAVLVGSYIGREHFNFSITLSINSLHSRLDNVPSTLLRHVHSDCLLHETSWSRATITICERFTHYWNYTSTSISPRFYYYSGIFVAFLYWE